MTAPNVLWLVMDTARADAFEPYGAPAGASPVVADLARRGAVAPRLRSTACWTLPSHVSMFTGLLPRAAGFTDQAGLLPTSAANGMAPLADRTIASVLRRAGYATGAVSANVWITPQTGFDAGFDRFAPADTTRQARMASPTRRARLAWLLESAAGRADDGARAAEQTLQGWAAEPAARPFFWFVNLVECHSPYLPPRPYGGVGLRDRVRAGAEAREFLTMEGVWKACVTGRMPSQEAFERMRALYAGAIRFMDDWLGRLLEALGDRLDDTLVIVSSDHGENFGENNLIAHGFSLDDRLIHLPLVAAGPGAETLAGARSAAELPRLIAEIAGAEHPYRPDDLPDLPVAQFNPPARPREDPATHDVIGRWALDERGVKLLTEPFAAAADGDLKLVVGADGSEAFYDLAADPLEATPLTAPDPAAAQRLRAALAHPAATLERTTWTEAAGQVPPAAPQDVSDLEDRMRLLGYL